MTLQRASWDAVLQVFEKSGSSVAERQAALLRLCTMAAMRVGAAESLSAAFDRAAAANPEAAFEMFGTQPEGHSYELAMIDVALGELWKGGARNITPPAELSTACAAAFAKERGFGNIAGMLSPAPG